MRKNLIVASLVIAASTTISGCRTRAGDYTLISSKNIDLSQASHFERSSERVVGEDKVFYILLYPSGIASPKEALDRAIESTPGAVALVNAAFTQEGWWAIFYGESSWVIEGTPLIDKSRLASVNTQETFGSNPATP